DAARLGTTQRARRSLLAIGIFGGALCLDEEPRLGQDDARVAGQVEVADVALAQARACALGEVGSHHQKRRSALLELPDERGHVLGSEAGAGFERELTRPAVWGSDPGRCAAVHGCDAPAGWKSALEPS